VLGSVSRLVQSIVALPALLTGMGVPIEMVDQTRWPVVRGTGKQ
jgi:L-fucose isomerase-like protein